MSKAAAKGKKKPVAQVDGVKPVMNPEILEKILKDVEDLYRQCEKKFMNALEDSDRRKIQLNYSFLIDKSDSVPQLDTALKFKDKTSESGMSVIKTFTIRAKTQMEDPNQPALPGTGPEDTNGGGEDPPAGE